MGFDLERVLEETEDFLRRSIPSRTTREARKRAAKRKWEEFGRRARRAGFTFVGLVALLIAATIFLKVGFFIWLVALPTIFLFCLLTLSWPSRQSRQHQEAAAAGGQRELPLDELAARAEEGLLERARDLPGRALPPTDAIMARLAELQPHLGTLDPNSQVAGDARRLIGRHLPQLVDSYLDLPASQRAPNSESSRRFVESLGIVADELDQVLETCCRDKQIGFETHHRFIETRYKDGSLNDE